MRIDVVTIFPAYLEPLSLSLIGAARRAGLLDLRVHDLRDHAHDRHRTVDDSPFGGGAGMVMKPEPWAEALDAVIATASSPTAPSGLPQRADIPPAEVPAPAAAPASGSDPTPMPVPHLLVPGPGGVPFTQAMARSLAAEPWLAIACGRYEGIDERVTEHAAARMPVTVVSLGDYVLNGGEVAALAIVEAVARLLPGVVGNADSLVEESHEDGLLEYPVYTRPAAWVDGDIVRDVPPVLLSGDHAAIAAWRHEQRVQRTAARRPDLLHPAAAVVPGTLAAGSLRPAVPGDVGELLTLIRAARPDEGPTPDRPDRTGPPPPAVAFEPSRVPGETGATGPGRPVPPLETARAEREAVDALRVSLGMGGTWVLRVEGRLVGAVRARVDEEGHWSVEGPVVAPDLRGRGIGRWLLARQLAHAPHGVTRAVVTISAADERGLRFLRKAGFRVVRPDPPREDGQDRPREVVERAAAGSTSLAPGRDAGGQTVRLARPLR